MKKLMFLSVLLLQFFVNESRAGNHTIAELQEVIRSGKCCENGVINSDELWGKNLPSAIELAILQALWAGFPENSDWNSGFKLGCKLLYPDGKEKEGRFYGPCPTGTVKVFQEIYDRDKQREISEKAKIDRWAELPAAKIELQRRNSELEKICDRISGIGLSIKEDVSILFASSSRYNFI